MMRKLLWALAASGWTGLVFMVGFWLTFPSQAVIDRLSWEVQQQSQGTYAVKLESVSPWWAGLKGRGLQVLAVDPRKVDAGDEDAATVLLSAESGRASVGLFSLMSGAPRLFGRLIYGDGSLDVQAVVGQNARGGTAIDELQVDALEFPISSLPPMGGVGIEGTGDLDLHVELDSKEGMRKANGRVTLLGEDITISKFVAPDLPMLAGFDVPTHISLLDLAFDVVEGRARVARGKLDSNLVQGELSGDVSLMEDLTRSRLRLQISFTLGDEVKMFKPFLKVAEQTDGSYRYRLSGTFARPRFEPEGRRSTTQSRRPPPVSTKTAPEPTKNPVGEEVAGGSVGGAVAGTTAGTTAGSAAGTAALPGGVAIDARPGSTGDARMPTRLPMAGSRLARPGIISGGAADGEDDGMDPDEEEPDASDVDPEEEYE